LKKEANKRIKYIFFDLDDVLYDTTLQYYNARLNAIRAMIEAGLPVDLETGYRILINVIDEQGEYSSQHFDKMLEKLGLAYNSRIVAAGVVAYHDTKLAFLKPYPETISTLLRLRDKGYFLGVLSWGKTIKQWEKLIRLGIQHLFHKVIMFEEIGYEKPVPEAFKVSLKNLKILPSEALYVADQPNPDILNANRAGLITVRIRRGKYRTEEPDSDEMVPRYEISKLSELDEVLNKILKAKKQ
jgi:putative hydrolase of the HAD superfamily